MKKIVFGLVALASVLSTSAMAAPSVGDVASVTVSSGQPLVQKAYYYRRWHGPWYGPGYGYGYGFYGGPGYGYGRCYRWRHICADRWGWGGPGFRRCLWRHGC
ncbi:glycosyl hydrolase family 5 [Hyphomicrobium sp.]|uniref:glycosyl hydrolase family 5 n=1 Tax=Hyphomicrobium sp. TaxID=82 RepID=UPI0025B85E7B|nr:glycosyl hydrolase family 5 [Hyphomicrobium sp.]